MSLDLDKLAAAKLWLVSEGPPQQTIATASATSAASTSTRRKRASAPRNLPYLATALYALVPVDTTLVARMACDERWRLYVNPEWLDTQTVPDVARELAHVTWHLLSDHAARARSQDVDRSTAHAWNLAADAAVSHTLDLEGLRPKRLTRAQDLKAPPGRSAEEYFLVTTRPSPEHDPPEAGTNPDGSKLASSNPESPTPGEPRDGCGSAADGIARPWEQPETAALGSVSTVDGTAIRRAVVIAHQSHVRMQRGTDPGEDLRWVLERRDTQMPWTALLSGAVRRAVSWTAGRGDYTYSRPSRRASVMRNIVLPGQRKAVPNVAIVIDTSGSMDDDLLALALGEVDGALASLGVAGGQVTVYSVDAAVHTSATVRHTRDVVLIGAGGTNLVPGLQAAASARPRPDVIVVLTDGGTPWPREAPGDIVVVVGVLGHYGDSLPPTPRWAVRVECILE